MEIICLGWAYIFLYLDKNMLILYRTISMCLLASVLVSFLYIFVAKMFTDTSDYVDFSVHNTSDKIFISFNHHVVVASQ